MLIKKFNVKNQKIFPILFAIGCSAALAANLMRQFGSESGSLAFIQGILTGFSIVLNIFALTLFGRNNRERRTQIQVLSE
jgi:hypothetical protein